jgi:dTDP-4-dehydrorhamnose reductase
VTGQLGHDVLLELLKRGHTAIGSGSRDMKIFVTGVGGQLGHDVVNDAVGRGHEAVGSDVAAQYSGVPDGSAVTTAPYVQLDITDEKAVKETIERLKPDAIIHCAAWTAVDAAEDEENKPKVHAINVDGTRYIAEAAKTVGAKMLYLSTDYVFDGKGERPWQPDDKNYAPLNYYGQTKLKGEMAVSSTLDKFFIVRIAWVFGLNGKNFIKTMINVGKNHDTVRVVNDQIGTPTYTFDLARLLVDMIETEKYGYYHATNEGGYISWADLAEESYKAAGMDVKVNRVTTAEYGLSKAARPENSRLDKSKLVEEGFKPLPDWKDAVARYVKEAEL